MVVLHLRKTQKVSSIEDLPERTNVLSSQDLWFDFALILIFLRIANSLLEISNMSMRILLFLLVLSTSQVAAQIISLPVSGSSFSSVGILNYAEVYEDTKNTHSIDNITQGDSLFAPLKNFAQKKAGSAYWLKIPITNLSAQQSSAVVSFINISYVDVWLCQAGAPVVAKKVGVFLAKKYISDNDGRSFVNLTFNPKESYTLYLKVRETKDFMPTLNFKLTGRDTFYEVLYQRRLIDFALMGGILILFIYILISWILSRFRPYIWLMVFSGGIGLYAFSLNGYLADWLMPNNPIFAWNCSSHFAHAGLAGACLLLSDFLDLGSMRLRFYKVFRFFPLLLAATSISMIVVVYLFNSYPYSLFTSTIVTAFIYPLVAYYIIKAWYKMPKEKRVFGLGVLLAIALGVSQNVLFLVLAEDAIAPAAMIASAGLICITLFFLVAIKEGMRQRQRYKYNTLSELSQVKEQQNILLEEKVRERTAELDKRNEKIKTLMLELQHRVKNNLQQLYGLNRMRMPDADDLRAREVWRKNLGQIKAMSLANNQMPYEEEWSNVCLDKYISDLVNHLRQMYDPENSVILKIKMEEDIRVKVSSAISIGLILTELLANSYQYAFIDTFGECFVMLTLSMDNNKIQLTYQDSGQGFNKRFFEQKEMGGFAIVKDLARQLGVLTVTSLALQLSGTDQFVNNIEQSGNAGIVFSFTFPISV